MAFRDLHLTFDEYNNTTDVDVFLHVCLKCTVFESSMREVRII